MKTKILLVALGVLVIAFGTASFMEKNKMNYEQEGLLPKQKQMALIAAFTARGDQDKLTTALNKGLDEGLTVNEIKEVLVQMYAYTGFPRSLNGISAFMAVMKERADKGIHDEIGVEGTPLSPEINKREFGTAVQTELAGQPVQGGAMDFAPAIDAFLKEHLFADIFGRGVLNRQERELSTIAALSSMEGVDSQLRSHLNIGMNTGLSPEQLKSLIGVIKENVGSKEGENAEILLNDVIQSREGS